MAKAAGAAGSTGEAGGAKSTTTADLGVSADRGCLEAEDRWEGKAGGGGEVEARERLEMLMAEGGGRGEAGREGEEGLEGRLVEAGDSDGREAGEGGETVVAFSAGGGGGGGEGGAVGVSRSMSIDEELALAAGGGGDGDACTGEDGTGEGSFFALGLTGDDATPTSSYESAVSP